MAESADFYRIAFEQSDRGLAIVSLADACFVDVNDRFCAFARRQREELVGSQWSLIAGIEDLDLIKSKIEAYALQFGEQLCCDLSVTITLDGDLNPTHVLIAVQDLMALKASELRARWQAEKLEALIDAVPASIWLAHDENCGRVSCNEVSRNWIEMPSAGSFFESDTRLHAHKWSSIMDANGNTLEPLDFPIARAARGETVNGFEGRLLRDDGQTRYIVGNARPLLDANGKPRGAVSAFIDITDRKRAEAREHLLSQEVDHRAKNILAVVQAIIQLTKASSVEGFRLGLTGRVNSMARAHTLLANSRWRSVDLRRLVEEELAPFGFDDSSATERQSFSISGPDVALTPEAAQALALSLHELATNAAKYGALSAPNGKVRVDWCWTGEEHNIFSLCWWEYDGYPTEPPDQSGFGGTVIRTSVEEQLNGDISYYWLPDGLKVEMRVSADDITDRRVSL